MLAIVFAMPLALSACGGDDGAAEDTTPPGSDPNVISWTSEPFDVPAGESFQCFYTDMITDKELSVVKASAQQGDGGHHVTLYYVDNQRDPHSFPCSGTQEMTDWHFVVGAGGEGNELGDFITLDEGLAIKIPAGKQLMVQAHYINTTGAMRQETDQLRVHLTDPALVKAYAADFVVLNEQFQIPAHSPFESSTTCLVEEDVQLAMLLGHMHEQGQHYTLERVDEEGEVLETIYEEDWLPAFASHPPVLKYTMDAPYVLEKGTRLRQTCKWNNTTDKELMFPTEMCIAFGYYFPGENRIFCEQTE
jgi:hypothetical protein